MTSSGPAKLAILGSTGSIGRSTLEVVEHLAPRFEVAALSAHRSFDRLVEQAVRFRPRFVIATDAAAAEQFDWSALPSGCTLLCGEAAVAEVVARPDVDTVVAAMVGSAGVRSTMAAVAAGKRVALANKESLVMAGACLTSLAASTGAEILPVDSEHSAIFQALRAGGEQSRCDQVRRVVLTASGGPFRNRTLAELETVTIEQALAHPTWTMGRKITIDSATMMNKALEIVEARWLFDLASDQIAAVIHPQSIVHSLVEFVDGSIVAQLSPPDMRLPIHLAMTFPERSASIAERLDWTKSLSLEFIPPDLDRFDALRLGLEAAAAGGTTGAVLSAANEAAVAAFLAGNLRFCEIVPTCRRIVAEHPFNANPTLDELFAADHWARSQVAQTTCTSQLVMARSPDPPVMARSPDRAIPPDR
jgi:1-deoxy-D-xylulose-5-phosphate reductoisomerase